MESFHSYFYPLKYLQEQGSNLIARPRYLAHAIICLFFCSAIHLALIFIISVVSVKFNMYFAAVPLGGSLLSLSHAVKVTFHSQILMAAYLTNDFWSHFPWANLSLDAVLNIIVILSICLLDAQLHKTSSPSLCPWPSGCCKDNYLIGFASISLELCCNLTFM